MDQFILYDRELRLLQTNDTCSKPDGYNDFIKWVKSVKSRKYHDHIHAIIHKYNNTQQVIDKSVISYSGTKPKVAVDHLPPRLQHILVAYMNKWLESN